MRPPVALARAHAAATHRPSCTGRERHAPSRDEPATLRSASAIARSRRMWVGSAMSTVELVGYLASALVFATFCMRAMLALRLIAIASNVAFIVYGHLGGLTPIVLLHAGLLPLNAWRLYRTLRPQDKIGRATPGAGPSMKFLRVKQAPQRRQDGLRHSRTGAPAGCWGTMPWAPGACERRPH